MRLNDRKLATVLAALRMFQAHPAGWMEHFTDVKPLTNDDIDALCEEINTTDNLTLKPAVIIGGAPSTKTPGRVTRRRLACPHCGSTALDYYYEDISNRRDVTNRLQNIGGNLTLCIDGFYETDGCDEGGDNPRLECSGCNKECTIPESVEVSFD